MTYALFQMREEFRQSLIREHLFYVEQAQKRLFPQFANVEEEAEDAAHNWLSDRGRYFDPDRDDEGSIYEAANDVRIEFYGLLEDMRENTRLSVAAGIYHQWDKELRGWITREMRHWHSGKAVSKEIWKANFGRIADFLECLKWPVRGQSFFPKLDACRLVVNVYKHGQGTALDQLRHRYPEYLPDPFGGARRTLSERAIWNLEYRDHTHLKISDEQLQEFSEAIVAFWKDVPADIYDTDVKEIPDWLEEAAKKDQNARKQGGKK